MELENHCFSTSVSKSLFIDKFIQVQTDDNVCYVVKIDKREARNPTEALRVRFENYYSE